MGSILKVDLDVECSNIQGTEDGKSGGISMEDWYGAVSKAGEKTAEGSISVAK